MTTNPDPTPDPVKDMPTPITDKLIQQHWNDEGTVGNLLSKLTEQSKRFERALANTHERLATANLLLEAEKQRRMAAELAHETDCGLLQAKVAEMEARISALRFAGATEDELTPEEEGRQAAEKFGKKLEEIFSTPNRKRGESMIGDDISRINSQPPREESNPPSGRTDELADLTGKHIADKKEDHE